MANGYVRQSAGVIINGNTIQDSHFNNEYNALASFADATSGHNHDGTAGGGALIDLTASVDGALPIANGGTSGTSKLTAQQALDLEPGVDIQPYDTGLASIAGLTTAADTMLYTTALDVYSTTALTAVGRTFLAQTTAANQISTLSSKLAAISSLTWAADNIILLTGTGTVNKIPLDPYVQDVLAAQDSQEFRVLTDTPYFVQNEVIAGFIAYPVDKTITIVLKIPYAGTIKETVTKAATGTCTATFKIDGVAVGGAANSVSTSESAVTRSTSNTFTANQDIQITIASSSGITDLSFSIKVERELTQ